MDWHKLTNDYLLGWTTDKKVERKSGKGRKLTSMFPNIMGIIKNKWRSYSQDWEG